uniref:Uncharacterized protein n=1 Tax=Rhizophora mucronata TaxID=61149 RepID=A0A2P2PIW0_RHIMU
MLKASFSSNRYIGMK